MVVASIARVPRPISAEALAAGQKKSWIYLGGMKVDDLNECTLQVPLFVCRGNMAGSAVLQEESSQIGWGCRQ